MRYILIIITFVYLLSILSYNELQKYYLEYIPVGLSIFLMIYYIIYLFKNHNSKIKNNMFKFIFCYGGSIILFILAIIFFNKKKDVWLYHSLWHIFSGLGGSLVIYPKFIKKNNKMLLKNYFNK